jgi:hypothetical protein
LVVLVFVAATAIYTAAAGFCSGCGFVLFVAAAAIYAAAVGFCFGCGSDGSYGGGGG